jgi:hypothetical protein
MNPVDGEKQLASAEQTQDAAHLEDFAEVEKKHSRGTDTEVDDGASSSSSITSIDSSASSSSHEVQGRQQRGSRPVSLALSRHVSESEVRDGIQNQRDPELGSGTMEKVDTTAPDPNDPNLVTWTGPDDPNNPKNWKFSKKWAAVFTVSLFTFISPVSSSLVAPALGKIADELDIPEACKSNLAPPSVHYRRAAIRLI